MENEPDEKDARAREAALRLSAMGGTMPGIKPIPRRRSRLVEDLGEDRPPGDGSTSD